MQNLTTIDVNDKISTAKNCLNQKKYSSVIEIVNKILILEPSHEEALYLLAVSQRYTRQTQESLATLGKLLNVNPSYGRAFQERGHTYKQLTRHMDAIQAYEKAVTLNPALTASWANLAALYDATNNRKQSKLAKQQFTYLSQLPIELLSVKNFIHEEKFYKAENLCRSFLQKNPHHIEAMRLLAIIGFKLNITDDAEFLLESCLEFSPDFHTARLDYVNVLHKRQKYDKALEQAKILREIDPNNSVYATAYANASIALGNFDTGLSIYNQLIEKIPANHNTYMLKGHALKTIGNQNDAIESYRKAFEIKPDHGDAFWSMANLKTYQFTNQEINQMQSSESADSTALVDRYQLCFALGKAYEDRQDFKSSYKYYERGNNLKKAELKYDSKRIETEFKLQRELCDKQFLSKKANSGEPAPDPIFIIGLPRAGSTLLEQILASHSMVDGTLELPNILALVHRLNGRRKLTEDARYPGILNDLSEEQLRKYGKEYIDATKIYRKGAPFFTDKMPNNFRHIGLIHLILPNAKIIDARRHPLACCFSGFKQLFAEGQEFTYSLEDVGRYYRGYVELMDHWHKVLPGKILPIQYEDVVADIETQVRRILDFCGLPFEQNCVDFHKTERAVQTASSEQVRQPLYQSGLKQWINFKPYLEPLIEALGPEVMERYPIPD